MQIWKNLKDKNKIKWLKVQIISNERESEREREGLDFRPCSVFGVKFRISKPEFKMKWEMVMLAL